MTYWTKLCPAAIITSQRYKESSLKGNNENGKAAIDFAYYFALHQACLAAIHTSLYMRLNICHLHENYLLSSNKHGNVKMRC